MKRKILVLTVLLMAISGISLFADNRLIFTEYDISYAKLIAPPVLENNTTGTYDTAAFQAKAGVDILKWADLYLGGDFMFFVMRPDPQMNYTFFPLYGGLRVNILPDMQVYPDIFIEGGTSIASYTSKSIAMGFASYSSHAWWGGYFNFGFDVNYAINDISIIALKIDRPSIASIDKGQNELHIIRAGIAWKMLY